MSNKRSLDQSSHLDLTTQSTAAASITTPTHSSVNHSKKVKFAVVSSSNQKNSNHAPLSSTFEPIDQSSDLNFDELNQVGKIRKGRVKVEGYDSDSSTENNEIRSSKKKSNGNQDDVDMFEDEQDDFNNDLNFNSKFEKIDAGLKIKKGAEAKDYLDLGDIEGQEFGKEEDETEAAEEEENENYLNKKNRCHKQDGQDDDGSADNYSDEEEDYVPGDEFANADDAPRARRKSKKGMGFLLSKFNMAEELQEGRMAADGSYVPSAKDPEAVHDNWLEGVNTKKTIKQAREAKRKREEQLRNQIEKDQTLGSLRTRKECYIGLLGLLPAGDGRSVSQIICQLGNIKRTLHTTESKKKKIIQKKSAIDDLVPGSIILDDDKNHNNLNSVTSNHQNDSSTSKSQEEMKLDKIITEITDLASTLMGTHGDLDIYDLTYGSIVGILKSEGLVPRDWIGPSNPYLETLFQSNSNNNKPTSDSNEKNHSNRKTIISRPTTTATNTSTQTENQASIYYRFVPTDPSDPNYQLSDPNKVFGPFDVVTMNAWAQQGFFGTDFDRIVVKLDHSLDGKAPWGSWNQIINQ